MYTPRRQNVSLNIRVNGYSVDLVPAKHQDFRAKMARSLILTTDIGRFTVRRARLAPAMISTPDFQASGRRQRGPRQPGRYSGSSGPIPGDDIRVDMHAAIVGRDNFPIEQSRWLRRAMRAQLRALDHPFDPPVWDEPHQRHQQVDRALQSAHR